MTIAFCQVAENLMVLNLLGRWNLAAVPDLSEHPIRASDPRKAFCNLSCKLEKLNLSDCLFLKELPQSIRKLVSLKEFSLDHSAIEELPDSVGYLGNLEKLSLIGCSAVIAIPGSVGNLRSLTEFLIDGAAVNELPHTISQLSYLKAFSVSNCRFLSK
ncbi:hypothetical protein LWI29_028993 [Acer saccharum]|uniref:Uncharacterized protein n=1 Tax=Acer saccharum TaxID=4024 RepID=A0AA39RL00_ACESA|nr:hypothetical protein LWI29_028993 [Acer saccharum]